MDKISLKKILKNNKYLEPINSIELDEKFVKEPELSRPGLALTGRFDHFPQNRVLLFGMQEFSFLEDVEDGIINELLSKNIPLIIFTRGNYPSEKFIEMANKNNVNIFVTKKITSVVFTKMYDFLSRQLAPETEVHGVLLNIYGKGVLIQGKSGIGKSEVALELVKSGHILIADDLVILKNIDTSILIGSAPEILQNKMEIRGLGIVDVQKLFGVTSVSLEKKLDLIVNLTDTDEQIDRIGNEYIYEEILGIKIKKIKIPILKGKNLSSLIEIAVANYQLKEDYDYDSSQEFINSLNKKLLGEKDEIIKKV